MPPKGSTTEETENDGSEQVDTPEELVALEGLSEEEIAELEEALEADEPELKAGLFVASGEKLPPAVRGLTPELAALADEAVETGNRYDGPNTEETQNAIASMKRYLNRKKFTLRVVSDGSTTSFQAVAMKERAPMSDEHRAKLRKALSDYRERKAAAQAAS